MATFDRKTQASSSVLEKGSVTTMATAHSTQKTRRALVQMRKAAMDAFLLGSFVLIALTITSVVFTYPWSIPLIYALAFFIALVLRLSKAAHTAPEALDQEQTLEEANETLVSEKTRTGLMLFWGNHPR